MTRVLGYTKKFIILKKDFSNMEDIKAKGHGKLEIKGLKGNLSISLENAEPDQYYNVIFVEGEKVYNLGKVYTENNGKSKEEIEFNISDLESKGLSLEKINGILITRDENVLLGEYIGKDNGSLERYIKLQSSAPKEEEKKIESVGEVEEEIDYPEEIEPLEEAEQMETEIAAEPEYIIEPEPVFHYETEEFETTSEIEAIEPDETSEFENLATEELEISEVVPEDDFVPEYEPIADLNLESEPIALEAEPQDEIKTKEYYDDYNRKVIQKNQTTKYVLSILRYFPYVDPFRVNLSGYNWWRIDYQEDEKGFLPYYGYVINSDKTNEIANKEVIVTELMETHQHYIFGLYSMADEVKYYVYGVPGGFHIDEHPYGGSTGFNTWFEGSDIAGYWLLYIDPLTGEVMKPINPMEPTD